MVMSCRSVGARIVVEKRPGNAWLVMDLTQLGG